MHKNNSGSIFFAERAPISALALIKAPVLWLCIFSSSSIFNLVPTDARSIAWPPAIPLEPLARLSVAIIFNLCVSLVIIFGSVASIWKARVCKASPANIAVASSNALWQVGLPRLKSSSSIDGKSS